MIHDPSPRNPQLLHTDCGGHDTHWCNFAQNIDNTIMIHKKFKCWIIHITASSSFVLSSDFLLGTPNVINTPYICFARFLCLCILEHRCRCRRTIVTNHFPLRNFFGHLVKGRLDLNCWNSTSISSGVSSTPNTSSKPFSSRFPTADLAYFQLYRVYDVWKSRGQARLSNTSSLRSHLRVYISRSCLGLRGHPSMDCVGPSFWCVGLAPVAPALLEVSTCGFMHRVP